MKLNNETVYFSYYNNRKTKDLPLERVQISLYSYEKGLPLATELFPNKDLFIAYKEGTINFSELIHSYYMHLQNLNPEEIYNKYKGKVLLCHESNINDCHRTAIRLWLKDNGFKAEELPR